MTNIDETRLINLLAQGRCKYAIQSYISRLLSIVLWFNRKPTGQKTIWILVNGTDVFSGIIPFYWTDVIIFLKWNFKSSSNSQSGFQTRTKIYNKTICWSGHNLHLVPWCHISILLVVNDHGFTTMPLSLLVTIRCWWRSLWRL